MNDLQQANIGVGIGSFFCISLGLILNVSPYYYLMIPVAFTIAMHGLIRGSVKQQNDKLRRWKNGNANIRMASKLS